MYSLWNYEACNSQKHQKIIIQVISTQKTKPHVILNQIGHTTYQYERTRPSNKTKTQMSQSEAQNTGNHQKM